MIDNTEQEYLSKILLHCEQQQRYYLTMAIILILLSWFFYFALRRPGALVIALILSIGLWYYPWRYFQRAKLLRLDLQEKQKLVLTTVIYAKDISKINRLQPYYYCYTEEEDFEITKSLYHSIEPPHEVTITYTPNSKTILTIVPSSPS
ncbi:MAG: hypothetical protein ACRBFS_16475 [Aureispira sp.]